eukprot:c39108_g1_i1 orf=2-238(-)
MSWKDIAPEGVYPIPGANAFFLEPCRIITSSYAHFSALPHLYYSRSFFLSPANKSCPPPPHHHHQQTDNTELKEEEEEE